MFVGVLVCVGVVVGVGDCDWPGVAVTVAVEVFVGV